MSDTASATTAGQAFVPQQSHVREKYNAPDADLILTAKERFQELVAFKVHKHKLAAMSSVFADMLETATGNDSQTLDTVALEESPVVVDALLGAIYHDDPSKHVSLYRMAADHSWSNGWSIVRSIWEASHKYDIPMLTSHAGEALLATMPVLSAETAIDMAHKAALFQGDDLLKEALNQLSRFSIDELPDDALSRLGEKNVRKIAALREKRLRIAHNRAIEAFVKALKKSEQAELDLRWQLDKQAMQKAQEEVDLFLTSESKHSLQMLQNRPQSQQEPLKKALSSWDVLVEVKNSWGELQQSQQYDCSHSSTCRECGTFTLAMVEGNGTVTKGGARMTFGDQAEVLQLGLLWGAALAEGHLRFIFDTGTR